MKEICGNCGQEEGSENEVCICECHIKKEAQK